MEQESVYKFGMDFNQKVIYTQTYYEFLKNAQVILNSYYLFPIFIHLYKEFATSSANISLVNMNEALMEKIKNSCNFFKNYLKLIKI